MNRNKKIKSRKKEKSYSVVERENKKYLKCDYIYRGKPKTTYRRLK